MYPKYYQIIQQLVKKILYLYAYFVYITYFSGNLILVDLLGPFLLVSNSYLFLTNSIKNEIVCACIITEMLL